jgi:hypothetical protein
LSCATAGSSSGPVEHPGSQGAAKWQT